MAREPHGDDHPTLMMRAADYTDRWAKWKRIAATVVGVVMLLTGVVEWGGRAYSAVKGFGPHELQFHSHVADSKEVHDEAEAIHQNLDADLHTIIEQTGVVQEQQRAIIERLDTLSTEQRWLECIRERDRDIEAGRPARECRPFGGGP